MKINQILISLLIGFILGCTAMYFIRTCKEEIIEVPITIEVPIPGVKDSFGYKVPVYKPYPVENPTNIKLEKELAKAKTQLDSFRLLKQFAKPRLFTRTFTDKIQEIKVDMIATGSVDSVKLEYNIFPKKISIDTIIPIKVPRQASLWVKTTVTLPYTQSIIKPSIKPGLMFITRKGNMAYEIEGDFINKSADIGISFKF